MDASNENPLDAQLVQTVGSDAGYPAKAMNAQMWDLALTAPEEAGRPGPDRRRSAPAGGARRSGAADPVAPAMPAPRRSDGRPAGPVGQVQAPAFIQSPPEQLAAPVAPAPSTRRRRLGRRLPAAAGGHRGPAGAAPGGTEPALRRGPGQPEPGARPGPGRWCALAHRRRAGRDDHRRQAHARQGPVRQGAHPGAGRRRRPLTQLEGR